MFGIAIAMAYSFRLSFVSMCVCVYARVCSIVGELDRIGQGLN